MAQSDNKKQFLVGSTGCAFKVLSNSTLKFLRFSFLFIIRRLFCVYKKGFTALAAGAGAASAIPDSPKNPFLWALMDSNHGPQSYQDCALTS